MRCLDTPEVCHAHMPEQLVRYANELADVSMADHPELLAAGDHAADQVRRCATTLGRPRPEMLIAAARLHLVGHLPDIVKTGFAPVDGAVHLLGLGWPEPVVALVAHQTQARMVARYLGDGPQLSLITRIQGWPADILDFAILTSCPTGTRTVRQGLEALRRAQDADDRIPARVREERLTRLLRAGRRVDEALAVQ